MPDKAHGFSHLRHEEAAAKREQCRRRKQLRRIAFNEWYGCSCVPGCASVFSWSLGSQSPAVVVAARRILENASAGVGNYLAGGGLLASNSSCGQHSVGLRVRLNTIIRQGDTSTIHARGGLGVGSTRSTS